LDTLEREIKEMNGEMSVAFCSYTGKAARVLLQKLKEVDRYFMQVTSQVLSICSCIELSLTIEIRSWVGEKG
jgi:hypothetical protein